MSLVLELPWPPSANAYWRAVKGRILVSKAARDYKQQVQMHCALKRIQPLSGPLSCTVWLYPPDRRLRDGHNYTKVLLDVLEGPCYANDRAIVELITRFYPEEVLARGRALVYIERVTDLNQGWQDGRTQSGRRQS